MLGIRLALAVFGYGEWATHRYFGVVWSWFDALAGTREVFVGTERKRELHAKHAERARRARG